MHYIDEDMAPKTDLETWLQNQTRGFRHLLLAMLCLFTAAACTPGSGTNAAAPPIENVDEEDDGKPRSPTPKPDKPDEPCHYNGHQLHIGKKGGCYYLYDGRKKEYVDRSYCNSCPDKKGK